MKRGDLLATLDIGTTIKKLRESKGISQEELAKDICDRTNITKLENGYSKIPSLSFVLLICEKLDITIQDFVNYAMENSYSLDKKKILKYLMDDDIRELDKYTKKINRENLKNKDKHYYDYLMYKINLSKEDIGQSKQYILAAMKNPEIEPYLKMLLCHELIKNKLIKETDHLYKQVLSIENLNKLVNKKAPIECLYLINELFNESSKKDNDELSLYLLELEIQFINVHECYNFLSYYYINKIRMTKDDSILKKDIENKLFAITNKKSN